MLQTFTYAAHLQLIYEYLWNIMYLFSEKDSTSLGPISLHSFPCPWCWIQGSLFCEICLTSWWFIIYIFLILSFVVCYREALFKYFLQVAVLMASLPATICIIFRKMPHLQCSNVDIRWFYLAKCHCGHGSAFIILAA